MNRKRLPGRNEKWGGWISLWHQFMAAQGFIMFAADNGGAGGHGHVFEEPLHFRLGAQEISDIRDSVHYLRGLPSLDAGHISIWGTHYGGSLALHAIFKDRAEISRWHGRPAPLSRFRECWKQPAILSRQ